MQPIYIDDGINIDPAFENHIGFSVDGLDWNFIHKEGLSVVRTLRNQGTTNPPSVIGQQKMTLISLVDITGSTRLSFDCNNVVNQAGWQGQTNAALNQAVSDITGWLNASASIGSVTVTSGNVGGFTALVSSNIVMSIAGAYASGDYMGTTTTPQSFSGAARTAGGSGIIKSLTISDKIVTANVDMELWLFRATFTAPTDNAAWAISDTEMLDVVGIVPISPSGWSASSNNQVYHDYSLSIPFDLSAGTSLYYALVSRGVTPAFTSLDLTLMLGILQD